MAAAVDKTLSDDFVRFCTTAAAEVAMSSRTTNDFTPDRWAHENPVNDFVEGGYENPVAWSRKYKMARDQLSKDVLFDNMEMKYIALAQYGPDQPEYIKWKIFGYNIVISFEYIFKGKPDKALEIIGDAENLLDSIGENDSFLKSIKVAMNHVTFSMKAHVLKQCCLETQMERFVMPNNMNKTNKAGLLGIQALFFYEYDIPSYRQISKDSILKAISLNEAESEWYFLLARVLRNYAKTKGHWIFCEEEFQASKTAVEIGDKVQHKLHLSSVYLRMFKNNKLDEDTKNQYLNCGIQILNEVIDTTNDLVLLKYSLSSLSKVAHFKNVNTLEKLINKLSSSDNGYVHGALGNYYLFRKMDYVKALFHLKKAYDAKMFGCSFDYIYTLYQMNSSTAPVEQMLVEMLKTFPHPVHQEKILSQIISYLLITKDDLIGALKYIPMLLSLKNITCVHSLQNHKMKFHGQHKAFDLLDLLLEKLNLALKNQSLSTDYVKRVADILKTLESFKSYVSNLVRNGERIIRNDYKKNLTTKYYDPFNNNNDQKDIWIKNSKQNINIEKNKDEGNWRTLKPDSNANSHIFSRGFQKPLYNISMEGQSWFNPKK